MLVFKGAVPLVKQSVSVLSSLIALLFNRFISTNWNFSKIVVALKYWAPQLQGRKFTVACDNSAAVMVMSSNMSKDPFMQRCLRQLWFTAAIFDFEVRTLHVPGRHNQLVDCLSRWHSDPSARDSFSSLCTDFGQVFHFQDVDSACFSFDVA